MRIFNNKIHSLNGLIAFSITWLIILKTTLSQASEQPQTSQLIRTNGVGLLVGSEITYAQARAL